MRKRTFYYKDETKDDFQNTKTSLNVTVDENYVYLPKHLWFKAFSAILYYVIAIPLLKIFAFFLQTARVRGRKNLKSLKKTGYFMYANHTHFTDAWLGPVHVAPFRRVYIIANKDAIQIPVVDKLVKALGCLPVADTVRGLKNLGDAVQKVVDKRGVVAIFPEAHIWYYYTGLRPFPITSFKFAAAAGKPAVPVATVYKKRKFLGKYLRPRSYIYIGEPIFPDPELSVRDNAVMMRDKTVDFIKTQLETRGSYDYYKYIKLAPDQTPEDYEREQAEKKTAV